MWLCFGDVVLEAPNLNSTTLTARLCSDTVHRPAPRDPRPVIRTVRESRNLIPLLYISLLARISYYAASHRATEARPDNTF